MIYKKHIFVCTNQRPSGARECCGEEHGSELIAEFKKQIKNKGLDIEMRTQRTGCFDLCEQGPTVAIYPEGVFYGRVALSDVKEIVTEHLENERIVSRLLITEK